MYDDIQLEDDLSILIGTGHDPADTEGNRPLVEAHNRIVAGFAERTGSTDGSEHDPVAQLDSALRENEVLRRKIAAATEALK